MNLFIDTHLDDIVIFLFDNNHKIIKKKQIFNEKQNSKLIMPTIKKILGNKTPTSIVVCNGPGSFTGVRLGVTIAKTLAYALNIPIRTIGTLECMALSLEMEEKIVAFNDKNGYYVAIYNNCDLIGTCEYLSNSKFEKYSQKYNVYTNVEINYSKILEYVLKKDAINPHKVNPIYIKKLDVEK